MRKPNEVDFTDYRQRDTPEVPPFVQDSRIRDTPGNIPDPVVVAKRFIEQGRHGDTYIGERLPGPQRKDFQDRIKRKSQDQKTSRGEQGFEA